MPCCPNCGCKEHYQYDSGWDGDAPREFMEPNHNLHRKYSAPYVIEFIEKELALLKIADRLKS